MLLQRICGFSNRDGGSFGGQGASTRRAQTSFHPVWRAVTSREGILGGPARMVKGRVLCAMQPEMVTACVTARCSRTCGVGARAGKTSIAFTRARKNVLGSL